MGRRTGTTATRDIVGGYSANEIGGDIESIRTRGAPPTLQRAVVIDVIMDPNLLSDEELRAIRSTVNNPRFADVLPVNSVVARIVSNEGGSAARSNTILFPFFSSHLQLPIQAGEIVEVIYDDFAFGGQQVGYWLTRTSSTRTVEDVNYTHLDRRFLPSNNPGAFSSEERQNRQTSQPAPGFPNGGNTNSTLTLPQSGSSDNAYNQILLNATSYQSGDENNIPLQTFEPVPRWRKRPQELVLQGANNTLIVLGEDRKGGPLGVRAEQNPDARGQAGSIDIVVGRGRILPDPDADPTDSFEGNTAPWVVENTRNLKETDKTRYLKVPGSSRLEDNVVEGDPDLTRDAARIYVTMQSEADVNFGLTEITYTENSLPNGDSKNEIVQPRAGEEGTLNKSYIVQKADHLRFIARKDEDNSIEGTVLIVREGTAEEDLCHLFISKDGVHVDGPKIILGRGLAGVAGAAGDPTPGGEPYIRWSKFRDTVDRLQEEIAALRMSADTQFQQIQTTFAQFGAALDISFNTAVAIPMSPVASLAALGSQQFFTNGPVNNLSIQTGNFSAETRTEERLAEEELSNLVSSAKSTKIFGE